MTDDDIVARLRAEATRKSWSAHVMSDDATIVHPLMREAAAAIERLTRERDTAVEFADAFKTGLRNAVEIAKCLEAAEQKVEKLREALKPFAEWCAEMEGFCSRLADDAGVAGSITMGDARRARAALAETESE